MRVNFCVVALSTISAICCYADDAQRKSRLDHLMQLAGDVQLQVMDSDGSNVNAVLSKKPLLKYTNPIFEEQADGALLMWTIGELPVAFASYSIRFEREVYHEFVSTATKPMQCQTTNKVNWAPKAEAGKRVPFQTKIAPPDSERLRLVHMRRLAERFGAKEMRLLTTPLHRYSSPKDGIIDGAVFSLVRANDPEVLVIIEAHKSGQGQATWRYSLGRMNSQDVTVTLDEEVIWEVKNYWKNPKSMHDPYLEAFDSPLSPGLALPTK